MKFPFNRQVCIFIMGVILVANSVYANTTIIAIRTEKAVFIGADSKAVPLPAPKCKIEQAGDIFFAITGTPAFSSQWIEIPLKPQETVFDFHDIIRDLGMTKIPIANKVFRIEEVLRTNLPLILEGMRETYANFCIDYPRNKIVIGVVIAGIENNIPVLYVREAKITTDCIEPVAIDIKTVNHAEPPKAMMSRPFVEQGATLPIS